MLERTDRTISEPLFSLKRLIPFYSTAVNAEYMKKEHGDNWYVLSSGIDGLLLEERKGDITQRLGDELVSNMIMLLDLGILAAEVAAVYQIGKEIL
ncbi:MAG: hypothetical protein AABW73_04620 [Nanoarchaeota archaeon]